MPDDGPPPQPRLLLYNHHLPDALRPLALLFGLPGILVFHAVQSVNIVANYYRDLDWMIRPN